MSCLNTCAGRWARPRLRTRRLEGSAERADSGLAASSGSIVAFLDDDAVAAPEWLARLAEGSEDPEVAAVGGSAEPIWADSRPAWFPREFDWVVGCSYLGMPESAQEVRNLFGCNMLFAAPSSTHSVASDSATAAMKQSCASVSASAGGRKVVYVPAAKVFHHVPGNQTRLRRFFSRCYFEGGSKAVVAHLVGASQALSSEYRYTRQVLPMGMRRGLGEFVRRGDADGLARAGAILAGLVSAMAGYAAATVSMAKAAEVRGWSGKSSRPTPGLFVRRRSCRPRGADRHHQSQLRRVRGGRDWQRLPAGLSKCERGRRRRRIDR